MTVRDVDVASENMRYAHADLAAYLVLIELIRSLDREAHKRFLYNVERLKSSVLKSRDDADNPIEQASYEDLYKLITQMLQISTATIGK